MYTVGEDDPGCKAICCREWFRDRFVACDRHPAEQQVVLSPDLSP